jgi:hypothetical protein
MNALSSAVGIKVDFDMALPVIASVLYRELAKKMRGYAAAQAGHLFRELVNMPATVTVGPSEVTLRFHRRWPRSCGQYFARASRRQCQ